MSGQVRKMRKSEKELIGSVNHLTQQLRNKATSSFGTSLLAALAPVIAVLDTDWSSELGFDAPSKKDSGIRILLNNFCRDLYQQIYGVKTDAYQFGGVKESLQRAEAQMARLYASYDRNGDVDALQEDPQAIRTASYHQLCEVRLEALSDMLEEVKDVYQAVTGTAWKYQAPGTGVNTKMSGTEAAQKIKAAIAAKKQQAKDNIAQIDARLAKLTVRDQDELRERGVNVS